MLYCNVWCFSCQLKPSIIWNNRRPFQQRSFMDIIYLHDLAVDCVIGAWDWEREITQTVYISLDMGWDIAAAAASDDLDDTLSYKDVSKAVSGMVVERKFMLVEAMAEEVAQMLLNDFKVPWCRVKINKKGAVRGAQDVGVIVERGEQA